MEEKDLDIQNTFNKNFETDEDFIIENEDKEGEDNENN